MVQFLTPAFLVGLVGLTIPIIIHLWNTRKSRIIKVGSIRFLQASESVKVSRVSLSEIPLLLLRLLIVLVLVLLLSNTRFDLIREPKSSSNWILVDPLLEGLDSVEDTIQSLRDTGWEYHLLQPNYPLQEQEEKNPKTQNLWVLLKELDAKENHPDSVLIISNAQMASIKGERPVLSLAVSWLIIPIKNVLRRPVLALSFNDSLAVFIGKREGQNITLNPSAIDDEIIYHSDSSVSLHNYPEVAIHVVKADTLTVGIYGKPTSEEYKNLEAAVNALNVTSIVPIDINGRNSPMILFNLTDSLKKGSWLTINVDVNTRDRHMLMPSISDVSSYLITKELSINNMLKYSFVKELNDLLIDNYQGNIRANSNMEMLEKDIKPASVNRIGSNDKVSLASLSAWLWILLLGLISTERIVSFLRKQ